MDREGLFRGVTFDLKLGLQGGLSQKPEEELSGQRKQRREVLGQEHPLASDRGSVEGRLER